MRVLIVDDYLDTCDMLAHVIRLQGHEAWTAGDGPAAVQLALEIVPHLVLLDIGMPIMDGYETARQMRSHAQLAGMRICAFTAGPFNRERALAAGFAGCIFKPLRMDDLAQVLAGEGEASLT